MDISEVAVLIVGYNNADDISQCLRALSKADGASRFDIFICENGGPQAYETLSQRLVEETICRQGSSATDDWGEPAAAPFRGFQHLELVSRPVKVVVGCANSNLGYGGGINAWLRLLAKRSGWKAVWILNPDTEPAPSALTALVARAAAGDVGMVGSTILESGSADVVRFRGGLQWQKMLARSVAIGRGEPIDLPVDLPAIERAMDGLSGASMYVTRRCIDQIGPMDESYFLFFEDLDWGVRAKPLGLGYACHSVVAHKRGTTTGSAGAIASLSKLSVYLQHRNAILFVRRHYPWALPIRIATSAYFAARFLLHRAPRHSLTVLEGVAAGIRGETGMPFWRREPG